MNRLIIVGNGFDLAHEMKTDYVSFVKNYIKASFLFAKNNQRFEDEVMTIKKQRGWNSQINVETIENLSEFKVFLSPQKSAAQYIFGGNEDYNDSIPDHEFRWQIKNSFIEHLFTKCFDLTWVDIENEYYIELKRILALKDKAEKNKEVLQLNLAFRHIISILEKYLLSLKPATVNSEYYHLIEEEIKMNELVEGLIGMNVIPQRTLILNFNYTKTITDYVKNSPKSYDMNKFAVINIHGQLNDASNPIIFGFGDELDKSYQDIEEEKVNGFLNYIKSFWYLKTSNYFDLIKFIDSSIFQVFILGHSCGLSDRTMLNMIFEHNNCRSIKIFYHKTEQGDNYEKLTQEISRHFFNKGEMRKKIISFDKSSAMPQLKD